MQKESARVGCSVIDFEGWNCCFCLCLPVVVYMYLIMSGYFLLLYVPV